MKEIIALIKNKNYSFFDHLYQKHSESLVNLAFFVMKKSFAFLNMERDDFYHLAYETCFELWKVNDETIQRKGIEKILKMKMVQKVILLARKNKTQANYILNNYVSSPDYVNEIYYNEQINYDKLEYEHILLINKPKIDALSLENRSIFYDYFVDGLSRKEICNKRQLSIQKVNQKINYLTKVVKTKFIK